MSVAIGVVFTVFALVVGIAVVLYLRTLMAQEKRLEERLHNPNSPVVSYAVPNGTDPSVFSAALSLAGFTSVIDHDGEHLLVACGHGERERVRSVIAGVRVPAYDGSDMKLTPVVFADEAP